MTTILMRWGAAALLCIVALAPARAQATGQCVNDWWRFPPTEASPPERVPPDLAVLCVDSDAPVTLTPVGGGDSIAMEACEEGGLCYRLPDGVRLQLGTSYDVAFDGGGFRVEVAEVSSAPSEAPASLVLEPYTRSRSCVDYGAWEVGGGEAGLYRWRVLDSRGGTPGEAVIGPWISSDVRFAGFEESEANAVELGGDYVVEVERIALDGTRSEVAQYELHAERVGVGHRGNPMFAAYLAALFAGGLLGISIVVGGVGALVTLVVLLVRRRKRRARAG